MQPIQQAFDRLRTRIRIDERGCWIWLGTVNADMYGSIRVGDKVMRTHRLTYLAVKGAIPRGKVLRHTCDVRQCCNPAHLIVGDHEDNTQDIVDRGRAKARRVLDVEEIATAKRLRESGATKRQIAEALRCSWNLVSNATDVHGIDVPRKQGRPRGSRNAHVRISDEAKAEIRRLYQAGGFTQQQLAEKFGCDQTYVSLIVR